MPERTVPVRVTRAEFRYDREHYERGDELRVHEKALESHPRSLERIDETEPEAEDDSKSEDVDEDEFVVNPDDVDPHPGELTVDELRDRVEDVDDVGTLKAIRHLEATEDVRSTALEAIDARLDELEK